MRVATQAEKVVLKLLAALMLLVPSTVLLARGQPDGATNVGAQACADCHQDLSAEFTRTVHSRLASFELSGNVAGCEACHGPGSKHIESLDTADIFTFSDEGSIEGMEDRCLSCHTEGMGAYWPFSEHSESGITCTSCHKIHQTGPNLPQDLAGPALIEGAPITGMANKTPAPVRASLKKPERLLCMDCHRTVGARMMLSSRHPVPEGKMECSSCHQVHGSEVGMIRTEERFNDLCLECHTSKQGPFVFDHPPVMEDCATCHVPHGSVVNNLLKQSEPFLCLQCHEEHFHAGREGISQPIHRPTGGSDNPWGESGWRRAFGTKCTQCHQAVHGTDLPSQSMPSQGKGLTR